MFVFSLQLVGQTGRFGLRELRLRLRLKFGQRLRELEARRSIICSMRHAAAGAVTVAGVFGLLPFELALRS